MNDTLQMKLATLPDSPGCYLMKSHGEIIYVGKAKNLKNRVRQYFQSAKNHTPKVRAMVEKVEDFDIMLVDTELEAFALECNLIKLHKPHYNILLKDDKHYPYIRIDLRDPFPRPELMRTQVKDGAKYFGPYISATVVREVMDILRTIFPIRLCEKQIKPGTHDRPCLHHQIGICPAPCAGKISSEDYRATIRNVIDFLNGKYEPVIRTLKTEMLEASKRMDFEKAAVYRDRINAVNELMEKQKAISTAGNDQDVIAALPCMDDALTVILFIRGGRLIGSESFVMERAADEDTGSILTQFLLQYYGPAAIPPNEILLSAEPEEPETFEELFSEIHGKRTYITVPQRGEKKRLVEMAEKNIRDEIIKRSKSKETAYRKTTGALLELAEVLGLAAPPRRIEGYDISNTQGAQSVASMVVTIDGKSANREYRHFRIKSVEGPNDFASMYEVITRRLTHGLEERAQREAEGLPAIGGKFSDLPDLILIDGGPGQLTYAQNAMHDAGLDIPMFALAERIDEIYLPGQTETILLDRRSEALHLIERLRDEAHRFGITHHRQLRQKASAASRLEEIPGVGPAKRKAILRYFSSKEALMQAPPEEFCKIEGIGETFAQRIYDGLHEKSPET